MVKDFFSSYRRGATSIGGEGGGGGAVIMVKSYVKANIILHFFFKKSNFHVHIPRKKSFTFTPLVLKGHNVTSGLRD